MCGLARGLRDMARPQNDFVPLHIRTQPFFALE
jgi:hypothetical protein